MARIRNVSNLILIDLICQEKTKRFLKKFKIFDYTPAYRQTGIRERLKRLQDVEESWSPTGKAHGTSMKYPPAPIGGDIFRNGSPGLRRGIRQ
jgi:hypothetical protein